MRYVLENWRVHGLCRDGFAASGPDPYSSAGAQGRGPALVAQPQWWMLCVGVALVDERPRLAG